MMYKYVFFIILLLTGNINVRATIGHGCHGHGHGGHVHGHVHGHRSNRPPEAAIAYPLKSFRDVVAGTGSLTTREFGDTTCSYSGAPALNVSCRYYIGKRLGLGIGASYQSLRGTCSTPVSTYTFTGGNTTIAVDMAWQYFNSRVIQMYGSFGLGASFLTEKDNYPNHIASSHNTTNLAMQCSPLGFRFGRALGGFFEIGYGYKGFVSAGISWQMRRIGKN